MGFGAARSAPSGVDRESVERAARAEAIRRWARRERLVWRFVRTVLAGCLTIAGGGYITAIILWICFGGP